MIPAARTRSRPHLESPLRAGSPLKHKHAVTPARHPPKRRRLGNLALRLPSSDSDSEPDNGVSSPRPLPRTRRGAAAKLRTKSGSRAGVCNHMSPLKRKRSDVPSSDSDSWVETENEAPEFIADDDQHLLQAAPAHTLRRMRKSELIRLWKVAGMWSSGEEEAGMCGDGDSDHGLGKVELVNGLLNARKQFAALDSSTGSTVPTLDEPFELAKEGSSHASSTLTSLSSESDNDKRAFGMDVDATPRAVLSPRAEARGTLLESPLLHAATRKKVKGRLAKPRVVGLGRAEGRKARFGAVKSPIQQPYYLTRRSSTHSSHYTTTDGSEDESYRRPSLKTTRHRPLPAESAEDHSSNVRSTPLIRRLRPRTRGSLTSNGSTEVEADAEDNGDDDEDDVISTGPSSARDRQVSDASMQRARLERQAKREALKAIRHGERDSSSLSPSSGRQSSSSGRESSRSLQQSPTRPHSGVSTRSQRAKANEADEELVDIDDDMIRTTRSGKAFGDMQERNGSSNGMEGDEFMDEDDDDDELSKWTSEYDLSTATMSSLTRLRRVELVQMCEARSLEVGGAKPQLARALLDWQDEQQDHMEVSSTTSSQDTARPGSPEPPEIVHAVASHVHREGQTTPVLMREHIHAHDPATPPRSEDDAGRTSENDLNLDLQELGLEDCTIQPEYLVKLEKIGSGGFKDVFVGKLRGRKVAISEFREHLSEMDIRELKLLAEFSHPNIVRFRGICIPEDSSQVPCMLISELCENGDLFDYIRNVPPPPLKRVLQLMLDIARGLEYLHLRKPAIIHRDCKSTNILINRQGVAKVGDFGLARVKHSTRSMIRSLVGTVNWQAPELWHPTPRYDYKVDVFSVGLVYWEMLSGWYGEKYPWEGHNEHYIYDAVGQKHKRPSLTGLRKHWGAEPVNLIERMWHQDPAERPTMSDVVADLEALITDCGS